jgi:hypothetical protein
MLKKPALVDKYITNLIDRHGVCYEPALLPADLTHGKLHHCFDVALLAALHSDGKYQYVEGLARTYHEDQWTVHAWLTDGTHAFDPTWRALDPQGKDILLPVLYFGVPLDIKLASKYVMKTGQAGIIPNRHAEPLMFKTLMKRSKPLWVNSNEAYLKTLMQQKKVVMA